jgi:hypothetical protein
MLQYWMQRRTFRPKSDVREQQEGGKHEIMRSFIIFTLYKLL